MSAVEQHERQAAGGDEAFHVEAAVEHGSSNHATNGTSPPEESVLVAYKLRFLTSTGQAMPKLPRLAPPDATPADRTARARLGTAAANIERCLSVATQTKSAMPAGGKREKCDLGG